MPGLAHGLNRADRAAFIGRVDDVDVGIGGDHVARDRDGLLGQPGILLRDHLDVAALLRLFQEAVDALRPTPPGSSALKPSVAILALPPSLVLTNSAAALPVVWPRSSWLEFR